MFATMSYYVYVEHHGHITAFVSIFPSGQLLLNRFENAPQGLRSAIFFLQYLETFCLISLQP